MSQTTDTPTGDTPSRVLLVDDEPDLRRVAELALGTVGGFEVWTAPGGEACLALVRRERFDVVLLDVMMPGLDGPAVLARLREYEGTREIPVVFLTAKAEPQEVERLRRLDVLGVITKPFDPMMLAAQVRDLLRFRSDPPGR